MVLTGSASTQGPPEASATQKRLGEAAPGTDASLPQLPQSPGRQAPPPTSLFAGSSQSWERLNAKQQRTLEGEGGLSDAGRAQPPPGWACRSPGKGWRLIEALPGGTPEGPGLEGWPLWRVRGPGSRGASLTLWGWGGEEGR